MVPLRRRNDILIAAAASSRTGGMPVYFRPTRELTVGEIATLTGAEARQRVEHVFGHIEAAMNGCYVRTIRRQMRHGKSVDCRTLFRTGVLWASG